MDCIYYASHALRTTHVHNITAFQLYFRMYQKLTKSPFFIKFEDLIPFLYGKFYIFYTHVIK